MFLTFVRPVVVGVLTTVFLSLLLWFVVSQGVKTGTSYEPSSLAKWLAAHVGGVAGVIFGVSSYMTLAVTPAVTDALSGKGLHIGALLIGAPVCIVTGLFFARSMSSSMRKNRKKPLAGNNPGAKI